jgi:hypothetical protein
MNLNILAGIWQSKFKFNNFKVNRYHHTGGLLTHVYLGQMKQ